MRRLMIVMLVIAMLSVWLLTACGKGAATTTTGPSQATGATTASVAGKTFTTAELAAFDGKNGNKAYIAVDGVVYDVTAVAEWGSKLHAGKFQAGKDYSAEIKKAPHTVEKLLTAVKIGVLKD